MSEILQLYHQSYLKLGCAHYTTSDNPHKKSTHSSPFTSLRSNLDLCSSVHIQLLKLFLHKLNPLSTLYHIILTFNNPEKEVFGKKLWEKEKMLVTSIFSFSNNLFCSFKNKVLSLSHIYFVICKVFQFEPF